MNRRDELNVRLSVVPSEASESEKNPIVLTYDGHVGLGCTCFELLRLKDAL